MGTFKKLINFDKAIRNSAVGNYSSDNSWTDVSGTTHEFRSDVLSNGQPFSVSGAFGNTYTIQQNGSPLLFPHLSSISDVPYNSTTVPSEITATVSVAYTRFANGTGWNANIMITGSGTQDETIRSLVFTKFMYYGSSNSNIGVVFAYILDNPITLNADNNYKANITLSVAFV